jgi:Zn ribbon nucleic-acid-binding protein
MTIAIDKTITLTPAERERLWDGICPACQRKTLVDAPDNGHMVIRCVACSFAVEVKPGPLPAEKTRTAS